MAAIQADVTLVGGGIMSATLAMLLHRLDPKLHICMVEQLGDYQPPTLDEGKREALEAFVSQRKAGMPDAFI